MINESCLKNQVITIAHDIFKEGSFEICDNNIIIEKLEHHNIATVDEPRFDNEIDEEEEDQQY